MELFNRLRMEWTAPLTLTALLMLPTLLGLSACSSASPNFTPEQIQWGVGCRGPNADIYCHYGG